MVSGDDDLVFVGCGGEPGERGLELCLRSCLRKVPGVYENVSRRKRRELGVAIVRVGDADNANGWNFVIAGFGDLMGGGGGIAYGVERFAGDEQRGIAPKL